MSTPEEITAALNAWEQAYRFNELEAAGKELARLLRAANPSTSSNSSPEPATPAAGEPCQHTPSRDRPVMHGACLRCWYERATALLADVARLTEMLAAERKFSGDAAARSLASAKERDKALATLAAVRKIADDYHDVDVRGTPPREVACNPCANDILNLLAGNYIP